MTFLTYAQNCEDVLLWRALGHVANGFYIDVGANDPVSHSVTKAFYDAGWRGINIEPLPSYHAAFREQRPHDVNLAIAAGAEDGSITLFDVPSVHGWASSDSAVAELHRAEGYEVTEQTVPVRTLAGICAQYAPADIHFLKVDVEGFEGEVLKGMDFVRWRPWVLLIEATLPNSRETNHHKWEHLVTAHGYRFAWFDGLNRYYVAQEHAELMAQLSVQPNVFDNFISYHLDAAWKTTRSVGEAHAREAKRADEAEAVARQARDHVARLLNQAAHMREQYDLQGQALRDTQEWARGLEQRLLAMLASTSWRLTAPVRKAGALVIQLRSSSIGTRVRTLLGKFKARIASNERARRIFIPLLRRYPKQVAMITRLLGRRARPVPLPDGLDVPDDLRPMPAQARRVLADLQRARSHMTGSQE
jgi:FkbM family methyltransferase